MTSWRWVPLPHLGIATSRGLEELNHVSGWIFEEDLRRAGTGHDVIAEADARALEPFDLACEVLDDELDAVPAPRTRTRSIGHGATGGTLGPAQEQAQLAAGDISEGGRRIGKGRESEVARIEGHGGVDIIAHVAHSH